VQKAGREAFIFGSDFPHEVFNAERCRQEIDQLRARGDLSDLDKVAVFGGNAKRFYRLDTDRHL
jgi:predicted TIM-barrel fold metal-dependent hydrolase